MKIYFTAGISNVDNKTKKTYAEIVSTLEDLGHVVIADHVLGKTADEIKNQSEKESLGVQRKMSKWKKQASVVIAEISTPSMGVGQEISQSLSSNRPVIALHKDGLQPHLLMDEGKDLLILQSYNKSNLRRSIIEALDYATEQQDVRFNFFISPKINRFLDMIAKKKRTPRAVYLRKLIEDDMKENKEYSE